MNTQSATQIANQYPDLTKEYSEKLRSAIVRSATDRSFRDQLLADPKAALGAHTGLAVTDVDIVFVENSADATIVLPPFVDPAAELSEKDLETVAGGTDPCVGSIILSVTLVASALLEAVSVRNS